MKFNWGHGIALFFSVFVLSLVYQVYRSTTIDNSLVFDDYYAKDLTYQQHYNKVKNATTLKEKVAIKAINDRVLIQFPVDMGSVSGEIKFFCPSASESDFSLPVQTDSGNTQVVPSKDLKKGLWKVRINWKAKEKEFFSEESIVL